MHNILGLFLLLHIIDVFCHRSNFIEIRNAGLRMVVFKEKRAPKILQKYKKIYDRYYVNSIVTLGERIYEYNNNLSEEERILIETILSLCY